MSHDLANTYQRTNFSNDELEENGKKNSAAFTRCEFYDRAQHNYIPLQSKWISQAGFTDGMPIKIRVMPDCIVITTQNSRELWGCAEGLSVAHFNKKKMNQWIKEFPGALNDTGLQH